MAVVLVEGADQLPALVGQYNATAPPSKSDATGLVVGASSYLAIAMVTAFSLWVGFC